MRDVSCSLLNISILIKCVEHQTKWCLENLHYGTANDNTIMMMTGRTHTRSGDGKRGLANALAEGTETAQSAVISVR